MENAPPLKMSRVRNPSRPQRQPASVQAPASLDFQYPPPKTPKMSPQSPSIPRSRMHPPPAKREQRRRPSRQVFGPEIRPMTGYSALLRRPEAVLRPGTRLLECPKGFDGTALKPNSVARRALHETGDLSNSGPNGASSDATTANSWQSRNQGADPVFEQSGGHPSCPWRRPLSR
jgi:hypothetical protein